MKPHSDDCQVNHSPLSFFFAGGMWAVVFHSSPFSLQPFTSFTGEALGHLKQQEGAKVKGGSVRFILATELWTPVICPKFTVVFPPGGWNLIPSLWGICDSPNFDVQGRCWFLLCHGWRCISHGSNWLFAIDYLVLQIWSEPRSLPCLVASEEAGWFSQQKILLLLWHLAIRSVLWHLPPGAFAWMERNEVMFWTVDPLSTERICVLTATPGRRPSALWTSMSCRFRAFSGWC